MSNSQTAIELRLVTVDKPEQLNVILGQAHFIRRSRTCSRHWRGPPRSSASESRSVRHRGRGSCAGSGNDPDLIELATRNTLAIRAGHSFIVFLREGSPVNVLNRIKLVPEVCRIYCATANSVEVIVAESSSGRGIVGVVDGGAPLGVETESDVSARRQLLRDIGYEL